MSNFRIAIVGAASLRGKELNEILGESPFASADFALMDDEETLGKLESVGDEVTFIQPITASSFEKADFTFFASDESVTRKRWESAQRAGSSIIDLSGALEDEPGVMVRAPWVRQAIGENDGEIDSSDTAHDPHGPDLRTPAIVPAHPAALALGLILAGLKGLGAVRSAWATLLEPASEYGRVAMDELHQQTVSLLSFQALPKAIYDAQVAFNATPVSGEEAKIDLTATESRIRRHYALISAGRLPELGIQLVHVPVFHGHTISIGVEFEKPVTIEHLQAALGSEHIEIAITDADAPTNLAAAGQEAVLLRIRPAADDIGATRRFWLWAATDNLKLAAYNAVACALELKRLRPHGSVQ
jgi:aspartate-semialdehyde dehydrogenase